MTGARGTVERKGCGWLGGILGERVFDRAMQLIEIRRRVWSPRSDFDRVPGANVDR